MAAKFGDAAAEAARLALKMGSAALDMITFMVDLGEEFPVAKPVLSTLKVIREKVETVKSNRNELTALEKRCTYITACAIAKSRQNPSSEMNVAPLQDCLKAVENVVDLCGGRGSVSRVLKASSDKDEIAELNARIDRLTGDLGLGGIATVEGKVDDMKATLEEVLAHQETIIGQLPEPPSKLARVPNGAPASKSWHVERRHVVDTVLEAFTRDRGPRLVGLVGDSGSGKTTAASEIVRSAEIRKAFPDGIAWLTVNDGAKDRLPSLMLQLARVVYEDIASSVGCAPRESDDSVAYMKRQMEAGHGGKGMKCLVVADNVWEMKVVSKLLETGMSVLLSTRNEELVAGAQGETVGVDELSEMDAESLLRKAAELSPGVRLPDDAVDLIELCGRVAMDLAFVGRWSTVRGRQDRMAWSDAAEKVRAEIGKIGADPEIWTTPNARTKRREAILSVGFEDLATGVDDERVPRLYLSLAVLPDGHGFSLKDAAVLLCDRNPSAEDEAAGQSVVEILERWSVLRSEDGVYRMHDAHSSFARDSLMDRGNVRRPAVQRWVRFISSLDALRSINRFVLKGLWRAVERVGGDGWDKTRPYVAALAGVDDSDPILRKSIQDVGYFQQMQEDWVGASTTWRQLLEAEKRELGPDHPFVLNTYRRLACWADQLGNRQEAANWRQKEREGLPLALTKIKKQLEEGGFDGAGFTSIISIMLRVTPNNTDETEQLLRQWLGIQEAKLGPEDVALASTLQRLAECARKTGRLEEAENLLRRCLRIKEVKLGPEDIGLTSTLNLLGLWVRKTGRLEEAEELWRRCLDIEEANIIEEDVKVANTLHRLAECARTAGRLEEADTLWRRCLKIEEAKLGQENVKVATTLHRLAECVREAGQMEEAESFLRRCLVIREARFGPDHDEVANTLHELGVCVRQAGRLEEAEELSRHARRMRSGRARRSKRGGGRNT